MKKNWEKTYCKRIGKQSPNTTGYEVAPEGIYCRCVFCDKVLFQPRGESAYVVWKEGKWYDKLLCKT